MSMYNCAVCDAQRCEHVINNSETDRETIERLNSLLDSKCDELKEAMILNGKLRLLLSEKGVDHDL